MRRLLLLPLFIGSTFAWSKTIDGYTFSSESTDLCHNPIMACNHYAPNLSDDDCYNIAMQEFIKPNFPWIYGCYTNTGDIMDYNLSSNYVAPTTQPQIKSVYQKSAPIVEPQTDEWDWLYKFLSEWDIHADESVLNPAIWDITTRGGAEFRDTLAWAYTNNLTMYDTINSFRPAAYITREQASKFFSKFALMLGKTEDTTLPCNFSDIWSADPTLVPSIISACRLWIIKWYNGRFDPKGYIYTDQSETMLMRIIVWTLPENWAHYYDNYHQAGYEMWLFGQHFRRMKDRRWNILTYFYQYKFPEYRTCQNSVYNMDGGI